MSKLNFRGLLPFLKPLALVVAIQNSMITNAYAERFVVDSEQKLREAIVAINSKSGAHFIDIKGKVLVSEALPPILNSVTIRGVSEDFNQNFLQAEGVGRLLTIGSSELGPRILVQIQDIGLVGGQAHGGDGQDGGGGGLGAGGAIFVNSRADLIVENIYVANNIALGGNGGIGKGGGGGGLAGRGGSGQGAGGGGLLST